MSQSRTPQLSINASLFSLLSKNESRLLNKNVWNRFKNTDIKRGIQNPLSKYRPTTRWTSDYMLRTPSTQYKGGLIILQQISHLQHWLNLIIQMIIINIWSDWRMQFLPPDPNMNFPVRLHTYAKTYYKIYDRNLTGEISGFPGNENEDGCLLGCCNM
jgi:hypothetical protein